MTEENQEELRRVGAPSGYLNLLITNSEATQSAPTCSVLIHSNTTLPIIDVQNIHSTSSCSAQFYSSSSIRKKAIHIPMFSLLNNQQNRVVCTPTSASKKCILKLSKYILTDFEEAVFTKDLNFLATIPHSNLNMPCAVNPFVQRFHRAWTWN